MMLAVLNIKFWTQQAIKQQLCGYLRLILQTIILIRHAEHCFRIRYGLKSTFSGELLQIDAPFWADQQKYIN